MFLLTTVPKVDFNSISNFQSMVDDIAEVIILRVSIQEREVS